MRRVTTERVRDHSKATRLLRRAAQMRRANAVNIGRRAAMRAVWAERRLAQ